MRFLAVILFLLFSFLGYSQPYPRTKGEHYFLKDAQGRIITTQSGGLLAVLQADTATSQLVLPPDTVQSFSVDLGGEPFTSLNKELKAYYSLEDASGDAIDSAGTNDLSPHGTISYEQEGKVGNCISFVSSGYLDITPNVFNLTSFSISLWLNTTDEGLYSYVVSNFGVSNYGWELYILHSGTGKARFQLRYSGGNIQLASTTTVNDGTWHHIVATFNDDDNRTAKLYIDGDREDIDVMPAPLNYNPACVFSVGSRLGTQYFLEGKIDELAIYNKELTQKEIDSLFAENVFPFPTEGYGGDSLRMRNIDFDERADTFRVNYKVGAWPTTRISDSAVFAFGLKDTADYNDTTFRYWGKKDTTANFELWSGLIPEDTWTVVPNRDTVFVDSSDITPPDHDYPGIWDTVLYHDFEERVAPAYWAIDTFKEDISNSIGRYGDQWYRSEEYRFPQWWSDNVDDSIVIDVETESKVLKTMWRGGYHDGYDGQSYRGGEYWKEGFPDDETYTELYASINIKMSSGFFANQTCGGKIAPGLPGGTPITTLETPPYGEGYWFCVSWGYEGDDLGSLAFYLYYQDQTHQYGQWLPWDDFQPTGGGIVAGDYNSTGKWVWPDDTEEWINLTVRVVTNTHTGSTPNYDGILEGYVNGRLVAQISGLYLITYPDIGNEINYHQFYQAVGGGNQPPHPTNDVEMWSFNDDIIVWFYDESVEDIPRGNELSPPGRVLNLPNWPKPQPPEE